MVFQSFCKFFEVFGHVCTCLDLSGPVEMRVDAFGCIRMRPEINRVVWNISDFFRFFETFFDFLDAFGHF